MSLTISSSRQNVAIICSCPVSFLYKKHWKSLTISSSRQKSGYNLLLTYVILVQETLETVEHSTAQYIGLLLIHHGHQQDYNGWSVWKWRLQENDRKEMSNYHKLFTYTYTDSFYWLHRWLLQAGTLWGYTQLLYSMVAVVSFSMVAAVSLSAYPQLL